MTLGEDAAGRPRVGTVARVGDRIGVLFWFYKDLPVCRNRLDLLRRDNPDTPIYGLYGGDPADAEQFRAALAPQLDDFWAFAQPVSSKWKWLNGDLMIAAWFAARGADLSFEHVFVVQWDMLVLGAVDRLVRPLAPDEVLLSAALPVAAVEQNWVWVRGGHEAEYRAFVANIQAKYGPVEPMSCVFVVACLPRRLLAAYAELPEPEVGYVEYRLPTLAVANGMRIVEDERFAAWRPADGSAGRATRRQRFLNGSRRSVLLPNVLVEAVRPDGARVFHPYHGLFPMNARWAVQGCAWSVRSAYHAARDAVTSRVAMAKRDHS